MFIKEEVTTKEQLDELYNCSAFTKEGLFDDDANINAFINWIKDYSELSDPLTIYTISGEVMNKQYHLTGDNKYPAGFQIISIHTKDIKNLDNIILPRFEMGCRWFDDIVDNNLRREREKIKPKCALIGQDGNIFNLMGIASRTLKKYNMKEEAKEMIDRITSSKSYEEALNIIGEYVEITDEAGLTDEEEFE